MLSINWDDDYSVGWVRTPDPRVIGVIVRDDHPYEPECCGQSLVRVVHGGGYRTAEVAAIRCCDYCPEPAIAEVYARAYDHWARQGWTGMDAAELAERYVRMFYGVIAVQYVTSESMDVLAFDTAGRTQSLAEWRAYLDGEVFSIGYLVRPEGVGEVDDDDVQALVDAGDYLIECGGFYGEVEAAEAAVTLDYLTANLPALLPEGE